MGRGAASGGEITGGCSEEITFELRLMRRKSRPCKALGQEHFKAKSRIVLEIQHTGGWKKGRGREVTSEGGRSQTPGAVPPEGVASSDCTGKAGRGWLGLHDHECMCSLLWYSVGQPKNFPVF